MLFKTNKRKKSSCQGHTELKQREKSQKREESSTFRRKKGSLPLAANRYEKLSNWTCFRFSNRLNCFSMTKSSIVKKYHIMCFLFDLSDSWPSKEECQLITKKHELTDNCNISSVVQLEITRACDQPQCFSFITVFKNKPSTLRHDENMDNCNINCAVQTVFELQKKTSSSIFITV